MRCLFEYTSVEEKDAEGRVVGHRVVVDAEGRARVQRIFQMYLDGKSYEAIAYQLNAEQMPPPRKGKYRNKGWVASTVREMLRNRAYIGIWTYGKKRWVKVPGTNSRRHRPAAPEQVITRVYEDRRIINEENPAVNGATAAPARSSSSSSMP